MPVGMGSIQRVGDLDGHTEENVRLDWLSGDATLQRHPLQKLHDDERPAIVADIVNGADVGVIESGRRLRFFAGNGSKTGCP
jgi:hypothetical protein